jgi:hypothetical protein
MFTRIITTIFLLNLLILPASAQSNAMALSITPPLIKNNITPGQIWKSTVKVVNNNTEELSVYVQAIDFKGDGEDGTVTFIPATGSAEEADYLLSQWINLPNDSITIPPSKSYEVPFIVDVPESAAPGGHYAAILVGTQPPSDTVSGASIKVSSLIASLIMLNVSGEVLENGQIREFSTDKNVYGEGEVNFNVRFENLGNVHIQPQGEIRIFDMWDKNLASIKINHSTEFGNVLPGNVRAWDFTWQDDIGLFDMGRYRAELILAYGDRAKETLSQTRYFWIFLFRPLAIIISSLLLFILIIYILVRRSIKKAIRETENIAGVVHPDQRVKSNVTILPKEDSDNDSVIVDLKAKSDDTIMVGDNRKKGISWRSFKRFILIIIFIAIIALVVFVAREYWPANNQDKAGESEIKEYTADVLVSENIDNKISTSTLIATSSAEAEELAEEEKLGVVKEEERKEGEEEEEIIENKINIVVLNGGGVPGAAGRAEKLLTEAEFKVSETKNADNFNYENTIIRYPSEAEASAKQISDLFTEPVELELLEEAEEITVIVGKNF